MANTLQPPPQTTPQNEKLVAPPAARRYAFLTDRKLSFLFISPAMALLREPLDAAEAEAVGERVDHAELRVEHELPEQADDDR